MENGMRSRLLLFLTVTLCAILWSSNRTGPKALQRQNIEDDTVAILVSRLDLAQYKLSLKGLTQFGDRRQGTQRNRDAIDWIEQQLQGFGCANRERLDYAFG